MNHTETGLDVETVRLIAVQDRNKHNKPVYAYGVWKVFVLCERIGGEFVENIETTEIKYFGVTYLNPHLSFEFLVSDYLPHYFVHH